MHHTVRHTFDMNGTRGNLNVMRGLSPVEQPVNSLFSV